MICDAFVSGIPSTARVKQDGVAFEDQAITIWPLEREEDADTLNQIRTADFADENCATALNEYDLQRARNALKNMRAVTNEKFRGDGPYLFAWSPVEAETEGKKFHLLTMDMSTITIRDDAARFFEDWASALDQDPEEWRDPTGLRDILARVFDQRGHVMLTVFREIASYEGFPFNK